MKITDQLPKYDIIIHEDDRLIRSIDVTNEDGTDYSFTSATAELIADADRPLTTSADLTLTSSGGDITLTSGNISIDAAHGLSIGEYEYDFKITVSSKVTTLFTGKLTIKPSV